MAEEHKSSLKLGDLFSVSGKNVVITGKFRAYCVTSVPLAPHLRFFASLRICGPPKLFCTVCRITPAAPTASATGAFNFGRERRARSTSLDHRLCLALRAACNSSMQQPRVSYSDKKKVDASSPTRRTNVKVFVASIGSKRVLYAAAEEPRGVGVSGSVRQCRKETAGIARASGRGADHVWRGSFVCRSVFGGSKMCV